MVLFRASSSREAIRKAEREARAYARGTHRNAYGQRVITRYLEDCDAFELFAAPADGREVYSRTEPVTKQTSDEAIAAQFNGARHPLERLKTFEPA